MKGGPREKQSASANHPFITIIGNQHRPGEMPSPFPVSELVLFKGNQEFNTRIWLVRKMPLPSKMLMCTYCVTCAAVDAGHTRASNGQQN